MRQYYEAREIPSDSDDVDTEFIRADITDMTDTERAEVLTAIKDVMSGVKCKFIKHDCLHDEHGACVMEEV